jgi:hypothetical protein
MRNRSCKSVEENKNIIIEEGMKNSLEGLPGIPILGCQMSHW